MFYSFITHKHLLKKKSLYILYVWSDNNHVIIVESWMLRNQAGNMKDGGRLKANKGLAVIMVAAMQHQLNFFM